MDFVTIFLLLIPVIALYVRAPIAFVATGDAALNLALIATITLLFLGISIAFMHLYIFRKTRRAAVRDVEVTLRLGRANMFFVCGLATLYFAHVHYLLMKESFEAILFSSEWFILSDLILLQPFLLPFVIFRAWVSTLGLRIKGREVGYRSELYRQVRTTSILLAPQLLYLNLYRSIIQDIPGLDRVFSEHPLMGFVVAGTLLFTLFVFSPYFIRLLFARVDLAEHPGGEELLPMLNSLARRSRIALDRVHVWLTKERRIANAAVSGLFRRQRAVFLTDHLLHCLKPSEVVAVVAHELGHARFLHLLFNFLLAIMSGIFVIWGLFLLSDYVQSQEEVGFAIVLLEVVYITVVFGLFARRFERQADLYAAHATGSAELVCSALLKLATANGTSIKKGSLTHPSIHARVKRLAALSRRYKGDFTRPLAKAYVANAVIALGLLCLFAYTMMELSNMPL
jgi:Zn-dependent protease with chaperone function